MEMKIIEQSDSLTHVALEGRLDITGVQQIERRFLDATAARKKPALIDLCDVSFMSSFGLGMLIKCAAILKVSAIKMVLLCPQPSIKQLLETTQLHQFIAVMDDKDEALKFLQGK